MAPPPSSGARAGERADDGDSVDTTTEYRQLIEAWALARNICVELLAGDMTQMAAERSLRLRPLEMLRGGLLAPRLAGRSAKRRLRQQDHRCATIRFAFTMR